MYETFLYYYFVARFWVLEFLKFRKFKRKNKLVDEETTENIEYEGGACYIDLATGRRECE